MQRPMASHYMKIKSKLKVSIWSLSLEIREALGRGGRWCRSRRAYRTQGKHWSLNQLIRTHMYSKMAAVSMRPVWVSNRSTRSSVYMLWLLALCCLFVCFVRLLTVEAQVFMTLACFWDSFLPNGLPCSVWRWGLLYYLIVSYSALFGSCLLEACFFLKGKQKGRRSGEKGGGGWVGGVEGGKIVIWLYSLRDESNFN